MGVKHGAGPICLLCNEKLEQAHPTLREWFLQQVKPLFPDCHVSWTYRGEEDQNACFAKGSSKLKYPMSNHNQCDEDGKPCARAIDLFKLDGKIALWPHSYFKDIFSRCQNPEISWGGTFKSIVDADHFEID